MGTINVHHHGHHHVLPALADERDGAVEVEERVADAPALDGRVDDLDPGARQELARRLLLHAGQAVLCHLISHALALLTRGCSTTSAATAAALA